MKRESRDKWVTALRGGKYIQHRGSIGNFSIKALCCLGVGADVLEPGQRTNRTRGAVSILEKHGFPSFPEEEREIIKIILLIF